MYFVFVIISISLGRSLSPRIDKDNYKNWSLKVFFIWSTKHVDEQMKGFGVSDCVINCVSVGAGFLDQ